MPEHYMTTRQAAEYLGLSMQTLRHYRSQGKGPMYHKRNARMVHYTKEDLDAWMQAESHHVSSTAEYYAATASN